LVFFTDPATAEIYTLSLHDALPIWIGPYLEESFTIEEVEKDVFIPFIHRPLSRYVNALADNGLLLSRMLEPAPPPGFLERAAEYQDAATIPRLLVLATTKH